MIFITHDLAEALKLGDRIAIMKDGTFVQVGTPEEVVAHPADDYVADFTRDVPRAHVLTARTIMRAGERRAQTTRGDVAAATIVQELLADGRARATGRIRVIDGDAQIGVVDRDRGADAMIEDALSGRGVRADQTRSSSRPAPARRPSARTHPWRRRLIWAGRRRRRDRDRDRRAHRAGSRSRW